MGVTTGATRCARSSQIITTNKTTPNFLQAGYPTCCPTISVRLLKEIFSECSYRTKFMLGFPKVCKSAQLLLCSGISDTMHYNIHILLQISMFLINFLNISCRYKIKKAWRNISCKQNYYNVTVMDNVFYVICQQMKPGIVLLCQNKCWWHKVHRLNTKFVFLYNLYKIDNKYKGKMFNTRHY